MATTTTNFGWTVPQSTDLVKDGATAIATLGTGVDTSFVGLKGGTTGQVLSKNSNTNLDYTWVTPQVGDITSVTAGTGISGGGTTGDVTITNAMATTIDAKGDLIAGTADNAYARLAVGTNNQVLTADSTTATGLKWASPASGLTLISTTTMSSVTGQDFLSCFTATYSTYLIVLSGIERISSVGASVLSISFYSGTNTAYTGGARGGIMRINHSGTAVTGYGGFTGNQIDLLRLEEDGNRKAQGFIEVTPNNGGLTAVSMIKSQNNPNDQTNMGTWLGGFNTGDNTAITGFRLFPAAGNMNGTVRIYGLANS